jgi:hypothetical protein
MNRLRKPWVINKTLNAQRPVVNAQRSTPIIQLPTRRIVER